MNQETAVVKFEEFALAKPDAENALEIIRANTGDKGLTAFDLDRIKVPSGGGTSWRLPKLEGDVNADRFDAVILHWADARRYWQKDYGSGANVPPDCYSDDGTTGIGDPGGACSGCPNAEFGTASKGKGQACKQVRSLYLMRRDEILPAVLMIPPTSLKPCRNFFLRLASSAVPFYGVITHFTLRQTANAEGVDYAQVQLSMAARLTPEDLQKLEGIRKELLPALQKAKPQFDSPSGETTCEAEPFGGDDF